MDVAGAAAVGGEAGVGEVVEVESVVAGVVVYGDVGYSSVNRGAGCVGASDEAGASGMGYYASKATASAADADGYASSVYSDA